MSEGDDPCMATGGKVCWIRPPGWIVTGIDAKGTFPMLFWVRLLSSNHSLASCTGTGPLFSSVQVTVSCPVCGPWIMVTLVIATFSASRSISNCADLAVMSCRSLSRLSENIATVE